MPGACVAGSSCHGQCGYAVRGQSVRLEAGRLWSLALAVRLIVTLPAEDTQVGSCDPSDPFPPHTRSMSPTLPKLSPPHPLYPQGASKATLCFFRAPF